MGVSIPRQMRSDYGQGLTEVEREWDCEPCFVRVWRHVSCFVLGSRHVSCFVLGSRHVSSKINDGISSKFFRISCLQSRNCDDTRGFKNNNQYFFCSVQFGLLAQIIARFT